MKTTRCLIVAILLFGFTIPGIYYHTIIAGEVARAAIGKMDTPSNVVQEFAVIFNLYDVDKMKLLFSTEADVEKI